MPDVLLEENCFCVVTRREPVVTAVVLRKENIKLVPAASATMPAYISLYVCFLNSCATSVNVRLVRFTFGEPELD